MIVEEARHVIKGDPVKHPTHYTYGSIECVDYILDKDLDFCLGNVIKYVTRAGHKETSSMIEDLEKAAQYLQFKIDNLKKQEAKKSAVR